jgi:hypothetical protein
MSSDFVNTLRSPKLTYYIVTLGVRMYIELTSAYKKNSAVNLSLKYASYQEDKSDNLSRPESSKPCSRFVTQERRSKHAFTNR